MNFHEACVTDVVINEGVTVVSWNRLLDDHRYLYNHLNSRVNDRVADLEVIRRLEAI